MIKSSARRDMCSISVDPHCIASTIKSRSPTTDMLLCTRPSKPNSVVVGQGGAVAEQPVAPSDRLLSKSVVVQLVGD